MRIVAAWVLVAAIGLAIARYLDSDHLAEQTVVAIDSSTLDLGDIWAQSELDHVVTLTNNSKSTLLMTDMKVSCSCARIVSPKFQLSPGERKDIRLVIDTRPRRPTEFNKKATPFSVVLYLKYLLLRKPNDFASTSCRIIGSVRSPFAVDPIPVDFGDLPVWYTALEKRVGVRCTTTVDALQVDSDLDDVAIKIQRSPGDDSCFLLDVLLPNGLGPGRFAKNLVIRGIVKNGPNTPSMAVPIVGRVLEPIAVVPEEIALGSLCVGEAKEEVVLLRNRIGHPFEIVRVDCPSPAVQCRFETLKALSERVLEVRQQAVAAGEQSTHVTIEYEIADKAHRSKVLIPISYYGVFAQQY